MTFEEIYQTSAWKGKESRSGRGSDLDQTQKIIQELPKLFKKYEIKSVLDIPCGDFNWMKEVDLKGINYLGADIVLDLIESNRRKYNYRFRLLGLTESLPKVDLILTRDSLVHLSYEDIFKALKRVGQSAKYLLATTFPGRENKDIKTGEWRPLNLEAAPFFLSPIEVINEGCTQGRGKYRDKSLALYEGI